MNNRQIVRRELLVAPVIRYSGFGISSWVEHVVIEPEDAHKYTSVFKVREVVPGDPTPDEIESLRRENERSWEHVNRVGDDISFIANATDCQCTEAGHENRLAAVIVRKFEALQKRCEEAEQVIRAYRHWEHCSDVSEDEPEDDDTADMLIQASFAAQEFMEKYHKNELRGEQ